MSGHAETRRTDTLLPALLLGTCAALLAATPDWRISLAIGCLGLFAVAGAWTIAAPKRWVMVFVAAAWLLPPLPLAAGNSGPHVAVAVAALGLMAGLVRPHEWRCRFDLVSGSLVSLFVAFAASVPLAFAWSGFAIGTGSAIRLALFGIAIYTYVYVRFGPGEMSDNEVGSTMRFLLWVGGVSAVIACIDFYFQLPAPAGYGAQFIWVESGVFRRAQGIFYEASTLGNLCAFLLELIAVSLVTGTSILQMKRRVLLFLAVPLMVALVLSYSRASILNLLVATVVLLWMHRFRLRSLRVGLAAVVLAAFGAVILSQIFPTFLQAYLIRAVASLQYFFESPNAVLSGRLATWTTLTEFILAHPLMVLVGTGYKTLPYSTLAGSAVIADNTWLSVLIETGIAGFVSLLVLNFAILGACYRAARTASPVRALVATWFLCFWCGQMVQMLSADLLTYWRLLPAYFCVLALATANGRERACQ